MKKIRVKIEAGDGRSSSSADAADDGTRRNDKPSN